MTRFFKALFLFYLVVVSTGCTTTVRASSPLATPLATRVLNTPTQVPTNTPYPTATAQSPQIFSTSSSFTFAVIGDYGKDGQPEQAVANLVKSWKPDFIITTGDNNYPGGKGITIDQNIGKYYHGYIAPYKGTYGAGASDNRFFPALGNHDWMVPNAKAFTGYFSLPGNRRYYDYYWGPVEFFAVDSDPNEPDGVDLNSKQAKWLKHELINSKARWKIVYFHHPPYSSGTVHGAAEWMRWPFSRWGATAVMSGHDHIYERLIENGIPYFVNGLGGDSIYGFGKPVIGSQARYAGDFGAMRVEVQPDRIIYDFLNRQGTVIDSYVQYAKKP